MRYFELVRHRWRVLENRKSWYLRVKTTTWNPHGHFAIFWCLMVDELCLTFRSIMSCNFSIQRTEKTTQELGTTRKNWRDLIQKDRDQSNLGIDPTIMVLFGCSAISWSGGSDCNWSVLLGFHVNPLGVKSVFIICLRRF